MTIDLGAIAKEETPASGLAKLLADIVSQREAKDEMANVVKGMEKRLEQLEMLATEQIAASGLDKCRVAGKTWWVDQTLLLSVTKDNRDAVLAAAKLEGFKDGELLSVNTSALKAWLIERVKESGGELADSSTGTAFNGLVEEFV